MRPATRVHACDFCGGVRNADEVDCAGCGARLERSGTDAGATARLLDMSTRMNRLLWRAAEAERRGHRRLRVGVGVVVAVSLVVLIGSSALLTSLAGSTTGVRAYPSVAAARSAVEERQREVAYQMMLDQGVFVAEER